MVLKIKRNIALFFSSIAILALLIHGILPHHHHDIETDKCHTDINLSSHELISNIFCTINSCCEDHNSNSPEAHVSNMNFAPSKQISISLLAVINYFRFKQQTIQPKILYFQDFDLLYTSNSLEFKPLRGPPLV